MRTIRCDVCGKVGDGSKITEEYTQFLKDEMLRQNEARMYGYQLADAEWKGWTEVFGDDLCPDCIGVYRELANPLKAQYRQDKESAIKDLDDCLEMELKQALAGLKSHAAAPEVIKLGTVKH